MSEYVFNALSFEQLGINPFNPTEDNLTFYAFKSGNITAYYDEDERFGRYLVKEDEIRFDAPDDDVKEFWDEYSRVHPEGIKNKAEEFENICHEFMEFTLEARVKSKDIEDR